MVLVVHGLVHGDVDLFNKDAISWNTIALIDIDYIADDEFTDEHALHSSKGSSINSDFLVVNLILQLKELPLLNPVTEATNKAPQHDTTIYGERLNVRHILFLRIEYRYDCINKSCMGEEDYVGVFKV